MILNLAHTVSYIEPKGLSSIIPFTFKSLLSTYAFMITIEPIDVPKRYTVLSLLDLL
jgi:hypothetical protein